MNTKLKIKPKKNYRKFIWYKTLLLKTEMVKHFLELWNSVWKQIRKYELIK